MNCLHYKIWNIYFVANFSLSTAAFFTSELGNFSGRMIFLMPKIVCRCKIMNQVLIISFLARYDRYGVQLPSICHREKFYTSAHEHLHLLFDWSRYIAMFCRIDEKFCKIVIVFFTVEFRRFAWEKKYFSDFISWLTLNISRKRPYTQSVVCTFDKPSMPWNPLTLPQVTGLKTR